MIKKTDPDEIQNYLIDAANFKGNCDAVYFPETAAEISELLKECNASKLKVTIAGNGTGLTGARVPDGGIVISTDKFNKILEINESEKYVLVQAGVILKDMQEAVEAKSLLYPPDPTERNAYIGGTVATNASGAKTFKYGPTRDYVLGMEVVLPTGEIVFLERGKIFARGNVLELQTSDSQSLKINLPDYKMPETKHAAGYFVKPGMDAIDLFIGSEGTLGVITTLKLKLIDLPKNVLSCVVFFKDEDDAFNFMKEARDLSFENRKNPQPDKIDARGLEYFDKNSVAFLAEDNSSIPASAQGALWFEQEFNESTEEALLAQWMELISKYNGMEEESWFAFDNKEQDKFKDFRHSIAWKVNEYISSFNLKKVGTDTAVPTDKFRQYYLFARQLMHDNNLHFVVYGHFGNSHMHLNMLHDTPEKYALARKLYSVLCSEAVKLGGTVSAEHGIGKFKRDYLLDMYGEDNIRKMAKLKKQIDPNLILGLGNIFEEKYFANP